MSEEVEIIEVTKLEVPERVLEKAFTARQALNTTNVKIVLEREVLSNRYHKDTWRVIATTQEYHGYPESDA